MAIQTNLFSYVNLVIRVSILRLFKSIDADTSLPQEHGVFKLKRTLKDFPCGIGIYENPDGKNVLIKSWQGQIQTYAYFQLLKEVRLYELLHRVLLRIGPSLDQKYNNVQIPRLLDANISNTKIFAVFEYIEDCKHLMDIDSQAEKEKAYELATGFWRYLGSHLTSAERQMLPRRNLFDTIFTYAVVLVYGLLRYPKHWAGLLRTLPIVFGAIPVLSKNWREDLVHRDFHFENILVNKNKIVIIDFGDNALTHPLQIFTNSLHWEWDNYRSKEIILKSIISFSGKSEETDKVFRALFAISAVQLLHDTESPERLKLNFRCFEGAVYGWNEISEILSGNEISKIKIKQSVKDRIISVLRKVRAPIVRFLRPISRYTLFNRDSSLDPLSKKYGFDRGTPIDRYYIEKFLEANKEHIRGRCLEIHDNFYTVKFGRDKVTKSDILDFNTENKTATIRGNLKNIPQVEDNTFDCVILTQTLGMIDDCKSAVGECYRILKPGGHILFTSKAMGPVFDEEGSYWKFTKAGVKYLFGSFFAEDKLKIGSFGNVLSGQAFWVGMAAEELKTEELERNDPRYEIIITAVAEK